MVSLAVVGMSVKVSVRVRRELLEVAEKMVRYGIARSRSHAFNLMIERGLGGILEEIRFWERAYERAEELEKEGYRLRHGGLSRILEEGRGR